MDRNSAPMKGKRFMKLKEVLERIGLGRSNFLDKVKSGLFPPQIHVGPRAVRWDEFELSEVQAAYLAGRGPDDIRALVRRLVAEREPPACGGRGTRTVRYLRVLAKPKSPAPADKAPGGRINN